MENVNQNTMKYKILFIFSFLLLTLLLFNTNVFASYNVEYNGTKYTISDLPETFTYEGKTYTTANYSDVVIYYYSNNEFRIVLSNNNSDFTAKYESSVGKYFISSDITEDKPFLTYNVLSNEFYLFGKMSSTNTVSTLSDYTQIVYSSRDIYNNSGELVFQAPVQGSPTLTQVLVKEQEEQPAMVLKEVLLILPLIIVILVSLVGLRKALRMLSTLLHRA